MGKIVDMIGLQFGKLKVIENSGLDKNKKNSMWKCQCSCGNYIVTSRSNLIQNHTLSCGCYNVQRIKEYFTTHGKCKSKIYSHYHDMKTRCLNKKTNGYKNYMGRGIKICDRWLESFEYFIQDMGEPQKGMTLERIDNEKGYSKENCKWIPRTMQSRNRRGVFKFEYQGEYLTAREIWIKSGKKYCYYTYLKYAKRGELCALCQ